MNFLITAGGNREYIDPVRFISNASSGQMGYALARAAKKAGHRVTLITAANLKPPAGVKVVDVETTAQMFAAVKKHFVKCNCLVMAAAVADYTPVRQAKTKMKKTTQTLTIKLKPTVDILKWASRQKKDKVVIGFALEDKAVRKNAEKKLKEKNLDMVIANRISAIGSDKSTVEIKTPAGKWIKIQNTPKPTIAQKVIKLIEKEFTPGS